MFQRQSINANFALSPLFLKACELAKVEPTKRQASAFRNGKGAAYIYRIEAKKALGLWRITFYHCCLCGYNGSAKGQPCPKCRQLKQERVTMQNGRRV